MLCGGVSNCLHHLLVRPLLELSAAWDPHLAKDVYQLERRAARFVMNDYRRSTSVTSLLNQREWSPLSVRRRNSRLVAFYRAVSNLSPVPVGQPRPCSHQTRLYDPVTFTPLRPQITTHHCRLELAGRCRSHYEPNRRLNHTMQVSSTSLSRRHLIEQNHKTPAVTGHTHCWIFHRSTKVTFDIDSCNGVIYRNGAHRWLIQIPRRAMIPVSLLIYLERFISKVNVKVKVWTLAIAPLTWVRLVTSSALQSRKDGSWLAWVNGTAPHYVAIHCPR